MKPILLLTLSASLLCASNLLAQDNALVPATRSTPTNWMSRHEGFVQEAKKGGVDILFMGDSITDGWRTRGKNVWEKDYANRHAVNFGIGGDRTQHVLWRIEHGELEGIHPKVAVLMIGTNNSKSDSPEDIAKAIKKIIDDFHSKIPSMKVLLLAVFPRNTTKDVPEQWDCIHKVNEIISKYDDGKTVRYLDIGPKFLGADGKVPKDIMPDFLHPNEKGYEIWAEAMEPTLSEMLK